MADFVLYAVILRYLPNITEYRVKAAKQHAFRFGRGTCVTMRVNEEQLDHFLTFTTRSHVIQDLAFGEDTLLTHSFLSRLWRNTRNTARK